MSRTRKVLRAGQFGSALRRLNSAGIGTDHSNHEVPLEAVVGLRLGEEGVSAHIPFCSARISRCFNWGRVHGYGRAFPDVTCDSQAPNVALRPCLELREETQACLLHFFGTVVPADDDGVRFRRLLAARIIPVEDPRFDDAELEGEGGIEEAAAVVRRSKRRVRRRYHEGDAVPGDLIDLFNRHGRVLIKRPRTVELNGARLAASAIGLPPWKESAPLGAGS